MSVFLFGIEALDKLLPNALTYGSLVVVAGHPGSGKTTLASTICYSNAIKGYKCLYISLQESKEKLFRVMKNLGMDFSALEKDDLYQYLRIPIIKDVEETINNINEIIYSWGPTVIVIDSINALIHAVEKLSKRAWLQNYFYSLPEITKGVVVLVAEVPFEEKRINLNSIEFVADVVIILRHRIERGLLTRYLEVRKSRGTPITLAEIPFTIAPGKGINILLPPILAEVGRVGQEIKPPCTVLTNILGHIHRGHSVFVEYEPDFRVLEATPLILGIALVNNLRAFVLSYLYSPDTMVDLLVRAYSKYCNNKEKILKVIEKSVVLSSLNPFHYSVAERLAEEFRLIRESQADMVVFHGVEIPALEERKHPEYIPSLYNQINILKQEQKIAVRVGAKISNELSNLFSDLADLVIKFISTDSRQDYSVYIWRRGLKPSILSSEDIDRCIKEITATICSDDA